MDTTTATIEAPQILAEVSLVPAPKKQRVPFTRENAAEFARKAVIAREKRIQSEKEARERDRIDAQIARDIIAGKFRLPEPLPGGNAPDEFARMRIVRLREQLSRIDDMIATERDPQELQRLTAATRAINEQECWLSNRPNPGSRRPGREPVAKTPASITPIEPSV